MDAQLLLLSKSCGAESVTGCLHQSVLSLSESSRLSMPGQVLLDAAN